MTSVYIVGNCHLYGMQRGFKFFDPALTVEGCHLFELKRRYADTAAFLDDLRRFDHVLTLSFGDEFLPGLTSDIIAAEVPQTTLYPTVTFGAFHPDVVYVFNRDHSGAFLPSPLGPYHSALALFGFRRGLSVEQTVGLFRAELYERLGYFSAWDVALDELAAKPEDRDFDLPGMAMGWLRQGCFMHNPQHPKAAPVLEIASKAMQRLGLRPKHTAAAPFLPDDLLASYIWPLYPEVGSYYGLPGTYTFKRDTGAARWPEFMTLEEFVAASYVCYAESDLSLYFCNRVDDWLRDGVIDEAPELAAMSDTSAFGVNMREGVIWAYRHLLGREPSSEAEIALHLRNAGHSATKLRDAFLLSSEYQASHGPASYGPTSRGPVSVGAALAEVVAQFQPFATEPPEPGSWRNFLGAQTRATFLPEICLPWAGQVLVPPGQGFSGVHDEPEWLGTLRSVLEARDRLVVVELGAGWAPWLVASAMAAKRLGIEDILLVGVEGSVGHVAFMRDHMRDNGIDPERHRVMHGVVGIEDGIAYFPKLTDPRENYGAEADFSRAGDGAEMEEVPTYSLQTLLADIPRVDILHCDIQGMEAEVFRAAQDVVDAKVSRIVVGTHSRAVEGELQAQFSARGWVLEADAACAFVQVPGGALVLSHDGTQVWRNTRLAA